MRFTSLEIITLSVLLPASFCGLAAAEESLPSTPPASIPDCQTKMTTVLVKNEAGESGESGKSGVASKPPAADAQAVIDACKAGQSARALEDARKLIAASPDRADLADLLVEAGGMLGTAKQFDPAAGFYRLLIDHYPQSKHLESAHAEFAACCYQSGKLKENLKLYSYNLQHDAKSLEAFGVLLRDFPYSVHAKQFIGKMPPAGPVTR